MSFLDLESQQDAYQQLLKSLRASSITYLSGHSASGKTTLAKRVLDKLDDMMIAIYIDCCNLTNPTAFLERIAQLLVEKFSTKEIENAYSNKVTTREAFIKFLRLYDGTRQRSIKDFKCKPIIITLDHVENLKRTNLIDTVQFLWSMTDTIYSINYFLISDDCNFYDSIKKQAERATLEKLTSFVNLKPWTSKDLVLAISRDKPKLRPEIYENFVRNTISCFSYKDGTGINRYYQVLKEICQKNFENYIMNFNDKKNDAFAANLMLRLNKDQNEEKRQTAVTSTATHTTTFICLLMSVYISSYTTASDDKCNFVRLNKRVRPGKRRAMERGEKPATSFTLERLLHIYRHLMAKILGKTIQRYELFVLPDQILEYVSLLEHMYLLHRCGGDLLDGDTRYRVTNRLRKSYVQVQAELVDLKLTDFVGIEN